MWRVEREDAAPLRSIMNALHKAQPHLKVLASAVEQCRRWSESEHRLAQRVPRGDQHPCDDICGRPQRIAEHVAALSHEERALREFLTRRFESLDLQSPPTDRKPRRLLLNAVEEALAFGGMSNKQIATWVDDGSGGETDQRADRVNSRRKERRKKTRTRTQ